MSDELIENSIFDSLIPYITGINLTQPATIDCYFPAQFKYDAEEIEKYFNFSEVWVETVDPVYIQGQQVRSLEIMGTSFHGVFKNRLIAEYLCSKMFGK